MRLALGAVVLAAVAAVAAAASPWHRRACYPLDVW